MVVRGLSWFEHHSASNWRMSAVDWSHAARPYRTGEFLSIGLSVPRLAPSWSFTTDWPKIHPRGRLENIESIPSGLPSEWRAFGKCDWWSLSKWRRFLALRFQSIDRIVFGCFDWNCQISLVERDDQRILYRNSSGASPSKEQSASALSFEAILGNDSSASWSETSHFSSSHSQCRTIDWRLRIFQSLQSSDQSHSSQPPTATYTWSISTSVAYRSRCFSLVRRWIPISIRCQST